MIEAANEALPYLLLIAAFCAATHRKIPSGHDR